MRVLIALLFCIPMLVQAETFSAKVIVVMDGDTVMVLRYCERVEQEAPGRAEVLAPGGGTLLRPPCGGGQKIKVRMANIDAPEKDQAFGKQSRDSLLEMVGKKQVQIDSQAIDQYGRMVGLISVDGLDVNAEQIRRGMAWEYSNFASLAASRQSLRDPLHSNKTLIALQHEAKQDRRGLWALSDPVPPWQWRKLHPDVFAEQRHAVASSASPAAAIPASTCGGKQHCSEMVSCEEASHYLTQCGIQTLDEDGDGVPCEKLCVTAVQQ